MFNIEINVIITFWIRIQQFFSMIPDHLFPFEYLISWIPSISHLISSIEKKIITCQEQVKINWFEYLDQNWDRLQYHLDFLYSNEVISLNILWLHFDRKVKPDKNLFHQIQFWIHVKSYPLSKLLFKNDSISVKFKKKTKLIFKIFLKINFKKLYNYYLTTTNRKYFFEFRIFTFLFILIL